MAVWSLIPVNLDDPNWEASSHHGPAIVRAPNEAQARAVAAEAFDVKIGFRPGQGMHFPPWTRPVLVKAERIDDPRFEGEGPPEVLEPRF
jgi:hypothetical protein